MGREGAREMRSQTLPAAGEKAKAKECGKKSAALARCGSALAVWRSRWWKKQTEQAGSSKD